MSAAKYMLDDVPFDPEHPVPDEEDVDELDAQFCDAGGHFDMEAAMGAAEYKED